MRTLWDFVTGCNLGHLSLWRWPYSHLNVYSLLYPQTSHSQNGQYSANFSGLWFSLCKWNWTIMSKTCILTACSGTYLCLHDWSHNNYLGVVRHEKGGDTKNIVENHWHPKQAPFWDIAYWEEWNKNSAVYLSSTSLAQFFEFDCESPPDTNRHDGGEIKQTQRL